MDRKAIMGVAAVAGVGLLLYLRRSGDSAAIGASGSLLGSAAAASNWASQPIVINATTKPAVVDSTAAAPAAAAKAPATAPAASTPWAMTAAEPDPTWGGMGWIRSNGKPVADGYALGHLTPEQRAGRSDAEIITRLII